MLSTTCTRFITTHVTFVTLVFHAIWMVPLLTISLIFVDVTTEMSFLFNRTVDGRKINIGLRLIDLVSLLIISRSWALVRRLSHHFGLKVAMMHQTHIVALSNTLIFIFALFWEFHQLWCAMIQFILCIVLWFIIAWI